MAEISYRRDRFPPVVIQNAIWLYLPFTLSYRDVEELLADRGLDISDETVRYWVLKFGPVTGAQALSSKPPAASARILIFGTYITLWLVNRRSVGHAGRRNGVIPALVRGCRF